MGSLPELRQIHLSQSPHHVAPRRSFGAATGLRVRPVGGAASSHRAAPRPAGQPLTPALLEIQVARRRESCASSVGATSVRRLVRGAVPYPGAHVGSTARCPASVRWTRKAVGAVMARFFAASSLLVLQAFQGSLGVWGAGPLLMSLLHGTAALAALAAPSLTRALHPHRLLTISYTFFAVFFALHLSHQSYLLVPAYVAAGLCWTPMALAHDTLLGELAASASHHDQQGPSAAGGLHRSKALFRRLTRASKFARDCGLLMAAVFLPFLPSAFERNSFNTVPLNHTSFCPESSRCAGHGMEHQGNVEHDGYQTSIAMSANTTSLIAEDPNAVQLENEEDLEEWREDSCGNRGCPGAVAPPRLLRGHTGLSGMGYLPYALCGCCVLAVAASLCGWDANLGRRALSPSRPPCPSVILALRDTKMKFAAPLAFFTGLEQGFFYGHFLQWYVVCVFGETQVWRVLGSAAFLRALVAATLSMLLAHGRRRLVAGVGLVWHACLLLALGSWRAADTDRNLPPGMAAAWAGCGAVWDILLPTIVDEQIPGGRSAWSLSLRALGLSVTLLARSFLCARWALRTLYVMLPAATIPLLFLPNTRRR